MANHLIGPQIKKLIITCEKFSQKWWADRKVLKAGPGDYEIRSLCRLFNIHIEKNIWKQIAPIWISHIVALFSENATREENIAIHIQASRQLSAILWDEKADKWEKPVSLKVCIVSNENQVDSAKGRSLSNDDRYSFSFWICRFSLKYIFPVPFCISKLTGFFLENRNTHHKCTYSTCLLCCVNILTLCD